MHVLCGNSRVVSLPERTGKARGVSSDGGENFAPAGEEGGEEGGALRGGPEGKGGARGMRPPAKERIEMSECGNF